MRNTYPIDMPIPHDAHPLPKCPCGAIGQHVIDKNMILCQKCMEKWVTQARATAPKTRGPPKFGIGGRPPKPDDGEDPNFCRCGHPSETHARTSVRRYCKMARCSCSRYDPVGHI